MRTGLLELADTILKEDIQLAQPNFQYEKRQKELAKKKKQEEKKQRKLDEKNQTNPTPTEPPEESDVVS